MHSFNSRLAKIEQTLLPAAGHAPYAMGLMHFDERGQCSDLEMAGQHFTPMAGETEDQLCDRAMRETGKTDHNLMLVQFVRAENGKPAPGFERFVNTTGAHRHTLAVSSSVTSQLAIALPVR